MHTNEDHDDDFVNLCVPTLDVDHRIRSPPWMVTDQPSPPRLVRSETLFDTCEPLPCPPMLLLPPSPSVHRRRRRPNHNAIIVTLLLVVTPLLLSAVWCGTTPPLPPPPPPPRFNARLSLGVCNTALGLVVGVPGVPGVWDNVAMAVLGFATSLSSVWIQHLRNGTQALLRRSDGGGQLRP